MKQSIIILIALSFALVQGWALPVDSLRMDPNTIESSGKLSCLDLIDDGEFNTVVQSSYQLPGTSHDLWFGEQKLGSTTTKTFTFKTYDLRQKPVGLVDNTGMFSMNYKLESQGYDNYLVSDNQADYPEMYQIWKFPYYIWKVTVTYKPWKAGQHSAQLWITVGEVSNRIVVPKTTYEYAVGVGVNESNPPYVKLSSSSLNFYKADTKSFKVTGVNLSSGLLLKKRGTGAKYFTLNKTGISLSDAKKGTYVAVTCSPTNNLQKATAYIDIYHYDKLLGTVTLTYAKNQPLQSELVKPDDVTSELVNGGEIVFGGELGLSLNDGNVAATGVDEMAADVKIYAEGQNIVIESAEEQSAVICDVAGRARTVNLQVGRNEVPVNANGLYIVRTREKTSKLMFK